MTERFKFSLSGMWLFVCLFTLLIPVFLPSFANSANPTTNVIGTATAAMFILSFPSSLFGIPLLVFVDASLGVDPNSIGGMYVNLLVMFVLGLVQWFWIVPRTWRRDPGVQVLNLPTTPAETRLQMFPPVEAFVALDEQQLTPIERVITQESETK